MPETWNIFISYAREDDFMLGYDKHGWVVRFYQDLQSTLRAAGNREVKIWYDKRMDGNAYLADTIDDATANSSLLVPLVSPAYLDDIKDDTHSLRRELDGFIKAKVTRGNMKLENHSRICPVFLRDIPQNQLPKEIGLLNRKYVFYDDANVRLSTGGEYVGRIQTLANELSGMLAILGTPRISPAPKSVSPSQLSVYLATATADWDTLKGRVKTSIETLRCRVVDADKTDDRDKAGEEISKCQISIHILGKISDTSSDLQRAIRLQQEVAQSRLGEHCAVWIPPLNTLDELKQAGEPENRAFFEKFDRPAGFKCWTLTESKFLEEIRQLLDELRLTVPDSGRESSRDWVEVPKVYVVCDDADRDAVERSQKSFEDRNWELELMPRKDSEKFWDAHFSSLRACQAFIMYYGKTVENSLRIFSNEFAEANRPDGEKKRTLPLRSRWIFRAKERTEEKANFRKFKYNVTGNMNEDTLPPDFIDTVTKA